MAYISDSTDFSTVNASANTAIATALPQGAINHYNSTMVVNTWYRYYDIDSTNVYETGSFLRLISGVGEQNGIMQKLSGLIVGQVYNIKIDFNILAVGSPILSIYSGTILQSSHTLSGDTSQLIQFTAVTTQDTILIDTEYIGSPNLLQIDSISITTNPTSLPYLTGFTVKPNSISATGEVTFTNGTSAVTPTQRECEAYGYTYNEAIGTCSIFLYNTTIDRVVTNENNRTFGAGNVTGTGTNNTLIMGENNVVSGFSRNGIITGTKNEIGNEVNNANVSGTLGEASADNSTVLGGNAFDDSLGERQSITLMYGAATTDSSTVNSYLNNTTDSFFIIPTDTIVLFETQTVAVRTGGTGGGSVGDYKSWSEVGVAINKSGVLSIDSTRTNISSSGTVSGWTPTVGVLDATFLQQVKGANNRDIMWATTIRFTQIKTGVTL